MATVLSGGHPPFPYGREEPMPKAGDTRQGGPLEKGLLLNPGGGFRFSNHRPPQDYCHPECRISPSPRFNPQSRKVASMCVQCKDLDPLGPKVRDARRGGACFMGSTMGNEPRPAPLTPYGRVSGRIRFPPSTAGAMEAPVALRPSHSLGSSARQAVRRGGFRADTESRGPC